MHERLVWMPLAQMNTVPGTAPRVEQPAPQAAVPAPSAPGAPEAAAPVTGGASVGPASQTGMGGTIATTQSGTPPAESKPSSGFFGNIANLVPIVLMLVVLYFVLIRGQRKEEKRRKELISELKKGDRVMTIGGMMARVVSIEGDEVVLKVDESANVKATYRKSAIQEVLTGDDKK
jgi:preprotein translocase subunit YajC